MDRDRIFRMTERCLYEHKSNAARLEALEADLALLNSSSSVKVQSYQNTGSSGGGEVGDPVGDRAARIQAMEERVKKLRVMTQQIDRLMRDLCDPDILPNSALYGLSDILRMYYWNGNVWGDVAEHLGIGRSVFFKRRGRLVWHAARYLGLTDELFLFDTGYVCA